MIIGMVTIAVAIVCVFLYVSKPKQTNKLSQSYLNGVDVDKLQKKVGKDFEDTYLLKDYVVYGETLSLYKSKYGSTETDKMQGNNIVLRNVMTDATTSFTFNGSIDSGVDLGTLKEGIYELYTYTTSRFTSVACSTAYFMQSSRLQLCAEALAAQTNHPINIPILFIIFFILA